MVNWVDLDSVTPPINPLVYTRAIRSISYMVDGTVIFLGGGPTRIAQGTQRWRATAESSLPRRSGLVRRCGSNRHKMDDADAGRARQHPSGPTRPWLVPGAQVDAVGGSHGDRVGESVSHSSLGACTARLRCTRACHVSMAAKVRATAHSSVGETFAHARAYVESRRNAGTSREAAALHGTYAHCKLGRG